MIFSQAADADAIGISARMCYSREYVLALKTKYPNSANPPLPSNNSANVAHAMNCEHNLPIVELFHFTLHPYQYTQHTQRTLPQTIFISPGLPLKV